MNYGPLEQNSNIHTVFLYESVQKKTYIDRWKKSTIYFHLTDNEAQEEDTPQIGQVILLTINHFWVLFSLRGKANVQTVQR